MALNSHVSRNCSLTHLLTSLVYWHHPLEWFRLVKHSHFAYWQRSRERDVMRSLTVSIALRTNVKRKQQLWAQSCRLDSRPMGAIHNGRPWRREAVHRHATWTWSMRLRL